MLDLVFRGARSWNLTESAYTHSQVPPTFWLSQRAELGWQGKVRDLKIKHALNVE